MIIRKNQLLLKKQLKEVEVEKEILEEEKGLILIEVEKEILNQHNIVN